MAQMRRVAKENIEKARQLLLSEIFREQTDDRFVKREAVKQLLGPLIAARDSGLSFDEIAKVFEKAGLELSPATLRSYYFELKTADELAREARRHAEKVTKAKAAIDKRFLELHNVHGQSVAMQYATEHFAEPTLYTALEQSPEAATGENRQRGPAAGEVETSPRATAPAPLAPAPRPAGQPAAGEPQKTGSKAGREEKAGGTARSVEEIGRSLSREIDAVAKTIEEIETASLVTEERTILEDDLVVKDGKVFYASGRAFQGHLSKKQVHLLRSVGKVIAPTAGRSSKEFVAMPPKL